MTKFNFLPLSEDFCEGDKVFSFQSFENEKGCTNSFNVLVVGEGKELKIAPFDIEINRRRNMQREGIEINKNTRFVIEVRGRNNHVTELNYYHSFFPLEDYKTVFPDPYKNSPKKIELKQIFPKSFALFINLNIEIKFLKLEQIKKRKINFLVIKDEVGYNELTNCNADFLTKLDEPYRLICAVSLNPVRVRNHEFNIYLKIFFEKNKK